MFKKIERFYESNVFKRSIIIWVFFQLLLWIVFGISILFHPNAWTNVSETISNNDINNNWLSLFLFIVFSNLLICILITIGNLFARFKIITPGLLIIIIQIISIGWLAGSNSFEFPFASIKEANIQYLKVGLWEITAYILIFSVTISKSLNISSDFLPKKWNKTRKLSDLKFNKSEIIIIIIAIISLITAAIVETYSLI